MAERLTVEFQRERDTKNTVRFQEVEKPGEAPVIGALYVQKHAWQRLGSPKRLRVEIVAEEE